eukprot:7774127-Lingulodinium_polyedra.AAC.1
MLRCDPQQGQLDAIGPWFSPSTAALVSPLRPDSSRAFTRSGAQHAVAMVRATAGAAGPGLEAAAPCRAQRQPRQVAHVEGRRRAQGRLRAARQPAARGGSKGRFGGNSAVFCWACIACCAVGLALTDQRVRAQPHGGVAAQAPRGRRADQ